MMFRSEWFRRHAMTFVCASALLFHSVAAQAQLFPFPLPLPTVATTDKGVLTGQSLNGVRQFLGVPYAAAPTSSRRWKAPAAESAYLLRDATRFAAHCPQSATPFGVASTNEDCLYLNVFAPPAPGLLSPNTKVPVLVWLHPGSLQSGESEDYIPTALVKRGFVVVTVNYRLGALGWLAHPALTAESSRHASGNYGLMDQQAALRWIQRNISNFGGDNKNVTIAGADAGAVSVYAHLASPDSAGLFQRAIAQSGPYVEYEGDRSLAEAEASGQTFATAVGCPQQNLTCLRAVSVSTLLSKQNPDRVAYLPNKDSAVLPEGVYGAIQSGHVNKVPVLAGTTRDEFRLYVGLLENQGLPTNASTYKQRMIDIFGYDDTMYYPPEQFDGSAAIALGAYGTDLMYACAQYTIVHKLAKVTSVWAYDFSDRLAPQELLSASFPLGAYHGADVQYLLDAPDGAAAFSADQQKLADTIKTYWTQFAKNGDPNGGVGTPAWPSYVATSLSNGPNLFMSLEAPTPRGFTGNEFLTRHGCLLWRPPYAD